MPNRILRDTALDSDRIAAVDEGSEVLFYRLLMLADDFGRFDGRPSVIRGRAFALRQTITEKEIERRLLQLSNSQLIVRYMSGGKPYLYLPRFGQRQRAEKSKFPAPDGEPLTKDSQPSVKGQSSAHVVVVEGVYEDVGVVVDVDVNEGGGEKTTAVAPLRGPKKGNGAAKTSEVESAYREAIRERYSVDPGGLNAKQRGMLMRFLARVPGDQAAAVVRHYVASNHRTYASARHCIDLLLRDAETIRVAWMAGVQPTESQARQEDETATRGAIFNKLIAEAREREKQNGK